MFLALKMRKSQGKVMGLNKEKGGTKIYSDCLSVCVSINS